MLAPVFLLNLDAAPLGPMILRVDPMAAISWPMSNLDALLAASRSADDSDPLAVVSSR